MQACTDNGSTPVDNTPNSIIEAIKNISESGGILPQSQNGTAHYTYSGSSMKGKFYQQVVFSEVFRSVPEVSVTITSIDQGSYTKYNAMNYISVSAEEVTASGFKVCFNANWAAYFPIIIYISWTANN